jgi:bifunctional UDP-N-acetylglucosamine pyrophosphorylase / glucosamine-1-phosphate N-acetyltransferase
VRIATIILAAGKGTRMKSNKAKFLHDVGGKPMVVRSVETAEQLAGERPVVVIGHEGEAVQALLGDRVQFATQTELLGTGHAVMQAMPLLRGKADLVVVYYSDMPLLRTETLKRLITAQLNNPGVITLLTMIYDDPRGFGRIIRRTDGSVVDIVEERECTPDQFKIKELNAGVYCFNADWLWDNLSTLRTRSNGEYYLTDMIPIAAAEGLPNVGIVNDDLDEVIGINTRVHLAEAEAALRRRVNQYWMQEGVTILDPQTTYIHEQVIIGTDTVILPNTHLQGATHIGADCIIGPNSVIVDSVIGDECQIKASVVEEAVLENNVDVGPFAHLRKGAYLSVGVHIGNFGEIKNARLGAGTRMGHFSYIGDAEVGLDVNIGAGTITANNDGVRKHKTIIGDHAFIGSDTILRAPLIVGANAKTGAGSVVTKNVPPNHLAVGLPARMRALAPLPTDEEQPTDNVNLKSVLKAMEPERVYPSEYIDDLRAKLLELGDIAPDIIDALDAQSLIDLAKQRGLIE